MPYYMDASKVTIQELLIRIAETDLVPSRRMLLEDIRDNFDKLNRAGIKTLADFRKAVKNPKNLSALSEKSGIGLEYLILLRREVESYFPKAFPLSAFDWLDKHQIKKLESEGFRNTALLYEAFELPGQREALVESIGLEREFVDHIRPLVNLTRIQWVSPIFAKMLVEAGFKNAGAIAEANAEDLHGAIERINNEGHTFKGKISFRDIKRLIKSASYVS
jgi:hypothetical protein